MERLNDEYRDSNRASVDRKIFYKSKENFSLRATISNTGQSVLVLVHGGYHSIDTNSLEGIWPHYTDAVLLSYCLTVLGYCSHLRTPTELLQTPENSFKTPENSLLRTLRTYIIQAEDSR